MLKTDHVMLFDLLSGGHHGTYLWYLVKAWLQDPFSTRLTLVVSPQFLTVHQEVVALVDQHPDIKLLAISDTEEQERKQATGLRSGFVEWRVFCQYAARTHATHALLMYFDYFQLAIAVGQKSPCPFSAIYFRPTFHYHTFTHHTLKLKDKVRSWRQQALLALALRVPQFDTLFCLDPFAVKAISSRHLAPNIVHLPDPVEIVPVSGEAVANLRKRLGIEPDRKIFLLFGRITGRKGVYKLFDAIKQLSPKQCQQICLLLVGDILAQDKAAIDQEVTKICQSQPIQILIQDGFLREAEVPAYFQLSDLVLALYQRHVGMSGILLLGAAAQKPMLVSNYGLMGELTQQYGLGLSIDAADPDQIAIALGKSLESQIKLDLNKAEQFLEQNQAQKFVETIRCNVVNQLQC